MPDDADQPDSVSGGGLRPGRRKVLRVRDGRGQPGGDRLRRDGVEGRESGAAQGGGGRVHKTRRPIRGAGPDRVRRRGGAGRHVLVGDQGVCDPRRTLAQGRPAGRQSFRPGRETGQNGNI